MPGWPLAADDAADAACRVPFSFIAYRLFMLLLLLMQLMHRAAGRWSLVGCRLSAGRTGRLIGSWLAECGIDALHLWFVFVRLTTAQCIWCVCCGRCALMCICLCIYLWAYRDALCCCMWQFAAGCVWALAQSYVGLSTSHYWAVTHRIPTN
jgi:hypothetical protein